jgi:hypothetical protein
MYVGDCLGEGISWGRERKGYWEVKRVQVYYIDTYDDSIMKLTK